MTNKQPQATYNLLMLSGDSSIAQGKDGAFYQMLGRFSKYWKRIDILTPTAHDATARCIHDNVYVHPAPYHRLLQPWFIRQQGETLFSERSYQLVTSHDFGFFYNGIGAQWLLQGKSVPLVSEIHHIEGYPIASTQREKLWRQTATWYIPYIARRGAYFRVVNQAIKEQLIQFGASADQIHTLYSVYLDLDEYQPQQIEKPYDVLFVARLAVNKGIWLLLEAIRIVKLTHPTITLAIRGDGSLKADIKRFITQYQLEENVIFLPRVVDNMKMPTLYNQAKMLVCASTVEGNPRVTIEAMACGVPVISTRVGIMPEVITHADNGLLVDWSAEKIANAIRQLLDEGTLYHQMAENGRQSVQRFDADTIIHTYATTYHSIIESQNLREN